jgi:phage portal protein BeeE
MNIIARALAAIGYEKRSTDPSWDGAALLRSGGITPGRAESLSAVYACVSAISETIASLPLILYRRTDEEGRERAGDHPLYKVLHDAPNEHQTALEFREMRPRWFSCAAMLTPKSNAAMTGKSEA